MRLQLTILISFIFFTISLSQSLTVQQVHDLSEKIRFVDLVEFSYNRIILSNKVQDKALKYFVEICVSLDEKVVEELLAGQNPKHRALGVISLYQSDDHKKILRIANYLNDTIDCFKPNPYPRFGGNFNMYRNGPTLEERLDRISYFKVSDLAYRAIGQYVKNAGYHFVGKEWQELMDKKIITLEDQIGPFLNERKDLLYSAGFLKLLKLKATGGISPLPEDRIKLVEELKNRIDEIKNETDRSIYKIYLSTYDHQLYSDEILKAELKSLGKDKIRMILEHNPPTVDPDLRSVSNNERNNYEYSAMCNWILKNSNEIFSKEDAAYFIKEAGSMNQETWTWHSELHSIFWHIAAARLDRENARLYLEECLRIFNGEYQEFPRGNICAEMLHLTGEKSFNFVSDWIFNSYILNEDSNERIDNFINCLNEKKDLKFIKHLIQSPKFESHINVGDVIKLAHQINILNANEFIAKNLINEIWHPYGLSRVEENRENALIYYPNETKEMIAKAKLLIRELKTVSNNM